MRRLATALLGLWICSGAFAAERLHNPVHPSWSPNGDVIVYEAGAKGDRQIVALSVQTLRITSLTRGSHTLVAPAFARDGDHIAFLRMGEVIELMVMGRDGSSPRRLAEVFGAPSLLTWTPDGRVGFVSATEPGQFDIYLADLNGGLERVTHTPYSEKVPDISPDGRQIAFQSSHLGAGDLFVHHLPNDKVERLTSLEGRERLARWSPDGDRIAFQAEPDGNFDLYILDLKDASTTQITDHPAGDSMPTWSPDGRRLAFVSTRPRADSSEDGVDLYVVDLESSDLQCLTCLAHLDGQVGHVSLRNPPTAPTAGNPEPASASSSRSTRKPW